MHAVAHTSTFEQEIVQGLIATPKRIASKFFYDGRGAELFEEICTLPEYYPTRTELGILHAHLPAMANAIGPHARIIEFGSGEGIKTKLLLEALDRPSVYIPIDISSTQLHTTAAILRQQFPGLEVLPLAQDYTQPILLPAASSAFNRSVVFFPGSTIGNFSHEEAEAFLKRSARLIGQAGMMLVGIDLVKNTETLERAYNDAAGVTAAFNLHLIERIRDELGVQIDPNDFSHVAFFNRDESRIEMHLVAGRTMEIRIGDRTIDIMAGEHIITEYSHKFTLQTFTALAATAGLVMGAYWQDERQYFAEVLLSAAQD